MCRLRCLVARRNPFKVAEDTTRSFRTGRTHTAKAGDFGLMSTSGANVDPAVFGSDAMEFRPGRENADRLLTWNNELRDIRSCGKHCTFCALTPPCFEIR